MVNKEEETKNEIPGLNLLNNQLPAIEESSKFIKNLNLYLQDKEEEVKQNIRNKISFYMKKHYGLHLGKVFESKSNGQFTIDSFIFRKGEILTEFVCKNYKEVVSEFNLFKFSNENLKEDIFFSKNEEEK